MRTFRPTVAGLMAGVLIAAVGLAALRNPDSATWASVSFALTIFALRTATLGAVFNRRASWAGFALFG